MAFQPKTFDEAKLRHVPLKRTTKLKAGKPLSRGSKRLSAKPTLKGKAVKKKAKKKKLTDGQLKKKVWTQFSIFIRTRGADSEGFNRCVTCGTLKHWKDLQAGHFIRGRLNANLFETRGCGPQCYICNVHFQGNVVLYYKWMLANYGQAIIDELIAQNNKTHKWGAGELQELLAKYKGLNDSNPLLRENPNGSQTDN